MSKNKRIQEHFQKKYGDHFSKVNEYFQLKKQEVTLVDLTEILPSDIGLLFNK